MHTLILTLPVVTNPSPSFLLAITPIASTLGLTLTQAPEVKVLQALPFGLRTGVRCMWVWGDIMQLLMNVVCGIFYVFYDILHADIHISAYSRRFF